MIIIKVPQDCKYLRSISSNQQKIITKSHSKIKLIILRLTEMKNKTRSVSV